MKIASYLENLNDDDRNTFYYLLDEIGINDEDIEVTKESIDKVNTKIDFLEEQISNIERKIIKELEGEYAEKGLEKSLAD